MTGGGAVIINGPDGYKYKTIPSTKERLERFVSVGLKVTDLAASTAYWCDLLGMSKFPVPAPASDFVGTKVVGEEGLACETVGYGMEQVRTASSGAAPTNKLCGDDTFRQRQWQWQQQNQR